MSVSTVKIIMERIRTASESSKIAVFRVDEYGLLDACFDATAKTQQLIRSGFTGYIGSFWKGQDLKEVKNQLITEANK